MPRRHITERGPQDRPLLFDVRADVPLHEISQNFGRDAAAWDDAGGSQVEAATAEPVMAEMSAIFRAAAGGGGEGLRQ